MHESIFMPTLTILLVVTLDTGVLGAVGCFRVGRRPKPK